MSIYSPPPLNGPLLIQTPYQNAMPCNPCATDPFYNPPPLPCPPPCEPCKKSCKCKKCSGRRPDGYGPDDRMSNGPNPCGPGGCGPYGPGNYGPYGPGGCGPCGSACGPKDPCPLKSFCDPGLSNTCVGLPIVNPGGPKNTVTTWKITYLVSNQIDLAAHIDIDLINPWGIVLYNNTLWVVNGANDAITNYDLFGNKISTTVYVRDAAHNSAFPTGIAINCLYGGFPVSSQVAGNYSLFLVCTEYGIVHAFNPAVDKGKTFIVLNEQLTGITVVYRGITLANNTLYLADFHQGVINVFDSSYGRLLGFYFIDGDTSDPIPLNYGPNNIVHIGCYLYVLYARRDDTVTIQDLDGPGHGYISVFNLDGSFVRRFTSRGVLNSPWAMIPAPCECGFPPGSFLVGNNGDGRINIFDCNGRYVGPMLSQSGLPLVILGLWGLAPHYTDFSQIFFTSSPNQDTDGILGSLIRDQIIQF